jgi:U1 small nuclear ribonucleoprotein
LFLKDPKDTPPKPHIETREEKRTRKRKEKQELMAYKIEQGIATWTPADNPKATGDPYKTLFVARIVYPKTTI